MTRTILLAVCAALALAACGSRNSTPAPAPSPANQAPLISAITDKSGDQDSAIGPIEFNVQDDTTPANRLTVTVAADGTSLFPVDGLVLGGDGTVRSLTLTPLEARTGTANITLTVVDAQGVIASRRFTVTVNARNASLREAALTTFAKSDTAEATPLNGFTFVDDADDPAIFAPLLAAP
jgi:hypothetical protein